MYWVNIECVLAAAASDLSIFPYCICQNRIISCLTMSHPPTHYRDVIMLWLFRLNKKINKIQIKTQKIIWYFTENMYTKWFTHQNLYLDGFFSPSYLFNLKLVFFQSDAQFICTVGVLCLMYNVLVWIDVIFANIEDATVLVCILTSKIS